MFEISFLREGEVLLNNSKPIAAIVLAAGAGTRMKSEKPKVAHELLGKPLIRWVIDSAKKAQVTDFVAVLGHKIEQVIPLVEQDCTIVEQLERNGTAGAVRVCEEALSQFEGSLLILSGDCPLITDETLRQMIEMREASDAALCVLTMVQDNPFGYGRIIRNEAGEVVRNVEQKDASPEEAKVRECNSGFYCFDAQKLFAALKLVNNDNAQHEYYLTDVIEILAESGEKVIALQTPTPEECQGINSRVQLAAAAKSAQKRINQRHLEAGVSMLDPDQVWIAPEVSIGSDTVLFPQTMLWGKTTIGSGCVIGPCTRISDAVVGEGCVLPESVVCSVEIEAGTITESFTKI